MSATTTPRALHGPPPLPSPYDDVLLPLNKVPMSHLSGSLPFQGWCGSGDPRKRGYDIRHHEAEDMKKEMEEIRHKRDNENKDAASNVRKSFPPWPKKTLDFFLARITQSTSTFRLVVNIPPRASLCVCSSSSLETFPFLSAGRCRACSPPEGDEHREAEEGPLHGLSHEPRPPLDGRDQNRRSEEVRKAGRTSQSHRRRATWFLGGKGKKGIGAMGKNNCTLVQRGPFAGKRRMLKALFTNLSLLSLRASRAQSSLLLHMPGTIFVRFLLLLQPFHSMRKRERGRGEVSFDVGWAFVALEPFISPLSCLSLARAVRVCHLYLHPPSLSLSCTSTGPRPCTRPGTSARRRNSTTTHSTTRYR